MSRKWTQFVGTVGTIANCGIPLAAVTHIVQHKDPSTIDPKMTAVLGIYSLFFMRWALAIEPANYALLAMHGVNAGAQATQLGRWLTTSKTSQPAPPQSTTIPEKHQTK
eukprot:TRINITY_DN5167_c0_g1_i1.p1 TRINITY_DN5167_c0_g1~~TRINITY_DN5167_c0_g1_i1.p1  ORF type:complete len:109 (+),score=0.16 TRINITY_DN5167_c0_g1_i1:137-463(+)